MPYVQISECAPLQRRGAEGGERCTCRPAPVAAGTQWASSAASRTTVRNLSITEFFFIFYIDLVLLDSGYGLVLLLPSTHLPPTW